MKQTGLVVSPCRSFAFCCSAWLLSAVAGGCGGDPGIDSSTDVTVESLTVSQLKIVSATASTDDGNLPRYAIDGNTATRWSGLGPGAYLTVDLGSAMSVSAFDVAWYRGNARTNTFHINASSDGNSYHTVYSGTSTGTTAGFEDYSFPATTARYLRLVVDHNSENNWASVVDVEAFGSGGSTHMFADSFGGGDGLITNEYAYWNPTSSTAIQSTNWEMNSGSLFRQSSSGWSGNPDCTGPNATSSNGNDSVVYRMMTKRADFGDVAVSFKLKNNGLVTSSRTPAQSWDGIHVWLRYQAEDHIYYLSVNRRDGTVLIKKKVPGGNTNGGTYYTLTPSVSHPVPYGAWQTIKATAKNNADGSVTLALYSNGTMLVSATDKGVGGPPITQPGKTGIRGDNCNFNIDDFVVDPI